MVLCPLSVALWGRAQVPQLWWWEPRSRRRWCRVLAAACGGSGRLVCFYLLPASPPVQLSGRSHDTLAYGLRVGLLDNSRGDSARRSTCAPCTCFGYREGDQGCGSKRSGIYQHFNQQVDPWYLLRLLADVVNNHPLFPPEDVDGQIVVLSLNSLNLRYWCGNIESFEAKTITSRILWRPVNIVAGWE